METQRYCLGRDFLDLYDLQELNICSYSGKQIATEDYRKVSNNLKEEQEQLLLHKIALGDEAAFKILPDRYKGYVFTITFKMLQSEAYAEDLLQEVFLKI